MAVYFECEMAKRLNGRFCPAVLAARINEMIGTTLLDIFQIRAEMYCRTLFGNHRRTRFGGTLTSKLKNPVVWIGTSRSFTLCR